MPEATTLLILGAGGDLTKRLLLPGIGSLLTVGEPKDLELLAGLRILGSGMTDLTDTAWRELVGTALGAAPGSAPGAAPAALVPQIVSRSRYLTADVTAKEDLERLLAATTGRVVIYFALPPAVVRKVVEVLGEITLPTGIVLAMEKPFGTDEPSAAALNRSLAALVPENQVHRIDHFLGLPTVLNLLGLRFANRIFEPVWNADSIESVRITYDEQLGLEGRAGYYDSAGALVDMIQSHLLQVLSIVAMEEPAAVTERDFRSATATVLRATTVWDGAPVLPGTDGFTRRARYTAGNVAGRSLPAYADEPGVDPTRQTETLAELVVAVNTRRWAGVPFVLRSGKAIGEPRRCIEVTFRPVPFLPRGLRGAVQPERLIIGVRPPTLTLNVTMNAEHDPFTLEPGSLTSTFEVDGVTEYGEVLRGVLESDPTLSIRGDVAEQCWRIIAPALTAWREGKVPLDSYPAGSAGPASWR